jgi:hypothetical protein
LLNIQPLKLHFIEPIIANNILQSTVRSDCHQSQRALGAALLSQKDLLGLGPTSPEQLYFQQNQAIA